MQGLVLALCLLGRAAALHTDAFESQEWRVDAQSLELDTQVKFVVALELHDKDAMHELLMRVSDPAHASYGSYWSAQQLSARFGPAPEEREAVLSFFRSIPGAQVPDFQGDMFEVTAPVRSVNAALQTELAWVGHRRGLTQKRAVRAVASLTLPPHLHPLVSFLSLNAPVNHVLPRAAKALDMRAREEAGVETVGSGEKGGLKARNSRDTRAVMDSQSGVGVEGGQTDALFYFQPYCGTTLNEESPPCASASAADTPTFHFDVYKHANDRANPYLLSPEPLHYAVTPAQTYCYNKFTTSTCSGADGSNCTCIAKLTDLPQYVLCTMYYVLCSYVHTVTRKPDRRLCRSDLPHCQPVPRDKPLLCPDRRGHSTVPEHPVQYSQGTGGEAREQPERGRVLRRVLLKLRPGRLPHTLRPAQRLHPCRQCIRGPSQRPGPRPAGGYVLLLLQRPEPLRPRQRGVPDLPHIRGQPAEPPAGAQVSVRTI
ncbi:Pro-kumamolisin, activation domain-containing protein [Ochromonadaceae sp. CCMP2298]|nr:Pro-kumamolisin, activation domain-containing protein [Ochromonadaceae sp. CCMP2298]